MGSKVENQNIDLRCHRKVWCATRPDITKVVIKYMHVKHPQRYNARWPHIITLLTGGPQQRLHIDPQETHYQGKCNPRNSHNNHEIQKNLIIIDNNSHWMYSIF